MPTQTDQERIAFWDSVLGAGNSESAAIIARSGQGGTSAWADPVRTGGSVPIMPRQGATERDVDRQMARTADTRELEIAHEQGSFEGAREQSLEEVRGVRDLTRTAQGDPQHGQRVEDLRQSSTLRAALLSLLPQTVEVGGDELTPQQRHSLQAFRNQTVRESQREAMALADEQNIPLPERAEFIQEQSRIGMTRRMNEFWGMLYQQARGEVMTERGHEATAPLPSGDEGTAIRMAATERTSQVYDNVVAEAFKDDADIRLGGGRVFRSSGPDEVAQPLAAAAERIREDDTVYSDAARQISHSLWRGRDSRTGEVTETAAGAGIRNLGLMTSVITSPVFQAATWDRDPATGLPLDPNDINYRLHRWTSGILEKMEASDSVMSGIGQYAMLLPAAISGAENITENTMSTGNVIRDFFIAHAQGEWEGSDIASLHALQVLQRNKGGYWNWHDDIFGVASGIAVPVGAVTTPLRGSVRMGADALEALARGAGADRVGDGLEALSKIARSPTEMAQVMSMDQLASEVAEELGGGLTRKSLIGRRLDGAEEVVDHFNRTLSDNLAGRLNSVEKASDLKGAFPSVPRGGMLDNIIQETFGEVMMLRNVIKTGRAGLMKTEKGRNMLNHIDRLEATASNIHPAAQARLITKSLLQEKLGPFIQKHIPNDWVYVGNSHFIVRKSSWLNNRDVFNKRSSEIIGSTLKEGRATYTNGEAAADYLQRGLGGAEYTPKWSGVIDDIRNGKSVDLESFVKANAIIQGDLAREIFKAAVVASDFSAPIAKVATAGRSFTRAESAQTIYKGLRAFFGGKSDYSWVAGFKKGDKIPSSRPNPTDFVKTSPPVFRRWYDQTFNLLLEGNRKAEDLIRAAIRAPDRPTRDEALRRVFREMSTGDVAEDYAELLNIFYSSKAKVLEDLISSTDKRWESVLAAGGKEVTADGIRRVVAKMSDELGSAAAEDLAGMAIKKRRLFWLTDEDDLDQLMAAWVTYRMKEQIRNKAFVELSEIMPNVMDRVPTLAMLPARKTMLRQQLLANGIPPEVYGKIESNLIAMLNMSDSDRRVLVNAVMKYMFERGGLATGDDLESITRSIQGSVAAIAGTDKAMMQVADRLGRSFESIRRNLASVVEANPALGTVDELILGVYPAVLKAATDLDMDIIRSRFSAFGVESSAAVQKSPSGLRGVPQWSEFGEVGRLLHDPSMEDVLIRLQKPNNLAKIQEAFENFRPADRGNSQWFLDMLQMTKRMTVTGLLGGFPLPNMRFMSNNLLGHWMIAAVTAPNRIMTVMLNTPNALTQSFVRAARRSGWWASDDVYDFHHSRYVAKPDEVLFETVGGEMWTKRMFDDAMDRNNLRFTQISHEFQTAAFEDWVRASQMGPDGKSIRSATRTPWNQGPISRGRFWEFLRPDKKNIWSMAGEEADIIQREAVFRAALKNGMNEESAALLARNSMLDYGAMSKDNLALETAKKYIPFFAFRYNMFRETAEAFLRDGRALQNIVRIGKMVNAQRESMEDWVLQPDYAKNRLFNTLGDEFREWHTINVGVQIPWMEHYTAMYNIGETAMRLVVGKWAEEDVGSASLMGTLGTVLSTATEALISDPRADPLKKWMGLETSSQAPSGYMPSAMLEAFATFGMLQTAVSFFGLEAIPVSEQRPDIPTFDGEQYRFKDGASAMRWQLYNEALLMSGVERNIRDSVRLLIRLGRVPEGVEARRDEQGNWIMYGLGGTTYSFESAQLARINAYENQMKTLREMSRQPTTRE
mgnify:CR=1 FL=1